MNFIRSAFWLALFIASTFCFLVLFEHGFSNFGDNSKLTFEMLKKITGMKAKAAPAATAKP